MDEITKGSGEPEAERKEGAVSKSPSLSQKGQKDLKKKKITIPFEEYEELQEKTRQTDEYFDKLLRLQAEFENFKKRMLKEKIEFVKYANEGIVLELLSITDNFERAVDSAEKGEDYKLLHQGVEMILKQLHQLLKEKGVSVIESIGTPFDPAKHEAIMHIPSEEYPEGYVVEDVQKGYILNGRMIRPAIVKVAKKTEETKTEETREKEEK